MLVALGSLALAGGWGWYIRSAAYRNYCAEVLSTSLGLPASIGRVLPRTRRSQEFRDVRVSLPERRGEAAYCRRAILRRTPSAANPGLYILDLVGGHCEVSTRTWLQQDYRTVLESGLKPGFDPAGPQRVAFREMDLVLVRDQFRFTFNDAFGVVTFDEVQRGRAMVTCHDLNGYPSGQPVVLRGEFSPGADGRVQLDEFELTVPNLPLTILGLEELARLGLQSGTFEGRVVYREGPQGSTLVASGVVRDVSLAEVTAPFLATPWRGTVPELFLDELLVVDGWPQRLRFHGALQGVLLGDVLAPWGFGGAGGEMVLRLDDVELTPEGLVRLTASGRCERVALEELSAPLGWGALAGTARVVLTDLTIHNNSLAALEAEVRVLPAEDGGNYVDRSFVSEAMRAVFGLTLPTFLPQRFAYHELGVRLDVRDELLHIFGTHGPGQTTLLTMELAGRWVPVIQEPGTPIDLRPLLDEMRKEARRRLAQQLRQVQPEEVWELWTGQAWPAWLVPVQSDQSVTED